MSQIQEIFSSDYSWVGIIINMYDPFKGNYTNCGVLLPL